MHTMCDMKIGVCKVQKQPIQNFKKKGGMQLKSPIGDTVLRAFFTWNVLVSMQDFSISSTFF